MNLQSRIRRGFAFVFLSTAGNRAIAFGADLALMRLLPVADFGAMAFGLLVINAVGLLHSLGLGEALVFRDEADQRSCDTAFLLSAGASLALFGVLYATAPWVALWGDQADRGLITALLRVLSALVVFQALAAVPNALLERELAFQKKLGIDTLPTLVYAGLAVLLAWRGAGVWSLVWGRLVAGAAGCAAAWVLVGWRPGWRFDAERARQIVGYGRYVVAASLVSFLIVNLDDALVLRLGGTEQLGFYYRAFLFANLPVTSLAHVVNQVAFPAFARLRDQPSAARSLYVGLLQGVGFVSVPAAVGMLLLAGPFTLGLLGSKWEPMVPLLQWLALYGFVRSLLSGTGPAFNAAGAPQAIAKVNLVQLAVLAAALVPLIRAAGALGASWGVLLGTAVSAPLALSYLRREVGLGLDAQVEALRPLLGPAAGMAAAILGVRWLLGRGSAPPLVELLAAGGAGLAVYGGWLWTRQRHRIRAVAGLLRGRSDG